MKKFIVGAALATSALIAAAPASAASVVQCQSGASCQISPNFDANTSISFSGSVDAGAVTNTPFTDIYSFTLGAGVVSLSVTSSATSAANDIDFSLVRLDGPGGNDTNLTQTGFDPAPETFSTASPFAVTGGTYQLQITGAGAQGFQRGSYGGSISFTPSPAVPEPATWAMMIGGFGLVGGAMRRTRKAKMVTA